MYSKDDMYFTSIETYTEGELKTYSEATLKLYYQWILKLQIEENSIVYQIYDNMVKEYGYRSVKEAALNH